MKISCHWLGMSIKVDSPGWQWGHIHVYMYQVYIVIHHCKMCKICNEVYNYINWKKYVQVRCISTENNVLIFPWVKVFSFKTELCFREKNVNKIFDRKYSKTSRYVWKNVLRFWRFNFLFCKNSLLSPMYFSFINVIETYAK